MALMVRFSSLRHVRVTSKSAFLRSSNTGSLYAACRPSDYHQCVFIHIQSTYTSGSSKSSYVACSQAPAPGGTGARPVRHRLKT